MKRLNKFVIPLCMLVAGYIFRTLMPYDPIIPFDLARKVDSLVFTKTSLTLPWSSQYQCKDFRDFVSIYAKNLPSSSTSDTEYFSTPIDKDQLLIDGISVFDNVGIIKWRIQDGYPYTAYPINDNWTFRYYAPTSDLSVESISNHYIPKINAVLTTNGFIESPQNNIPLYEYPSSHAKARKIGYTKNNYMYYVTIIEEPVIDQPASDIRISLDCGEILPELKDIYNNFMAYPHTFTNETTIIYAGSDNTLTQFNLLYPGTTVTQLKNSWVKINDNNIELIYENDNFLPCNILNTKDTESNYFCFDTKIQEFKRL